jgi:cytochrome c oxidase subunit IV
MASGDHHEHSHPTVGTYLAVAVVLVMLTVVEVGVFYVPGFKAVLVPILLVLMTAKFALVAMFYMHLKQDSKVFTLLFSLPLLIGTAIVLALLALFGALFVSR